MLDVAKQIFLQQMIGKSHIQLNDAIALMNKISTELSKLSDDPVPKQIGMNFIKTTIKEINSKIKPEEIQMSITRCEASGEKYLTLHSIGHNDITEQQTFFTPLELAYWLPLMETIVKSNTKSISNIQCLNLVAQFQLQIKLDDVETFLAKCCQKGYLVYHDSLYFLGSRAICEFNKELRRTYEDYVNICELCSEICCYGKACVNCSKVMHAYCIQSALETNNECPLCNVEWGNFDFQQEDNNRMANDTESSSMSL